MITIYAFLRHTQSYHAEVRQRCVDTAPSLRAGVVAWTNFTSVIPWLDHGIQLKILKLLVFFIVFMDPVVKPRGDTVGFIGLRNNALRAVVVLAWQSHEIITNS
ncbi:hypothetical protein [Rickettsia hoogstraalii]|uniref:hypothetical protein n=1 Tax=Rickettsia hoogstraalii TaxID=467174 RepID=UPI0018CF3C9D|nr:hypothetical protein [Rickettsia hoogstraalii]